MPLIRCTLALLTTASLFVGGDLLARPLLPRGFPESPIARQADELAALERHLTRLTEELKLLRGRDQPNATPATSGAATATGSERNEQDSEGAEQLRQRIDELERRIDILTEELERLRSGETRGAQPDPEDTRALGLAPSAASLYRRTQGVSIAGYGEMVYENFADEDESGDPADGGAEVNFLRAVLYAGYRFDDKFLFNSEIEVEDTDEVELEFAYVDYLVSEDFGLRAGLLLMPMGLVNEFHEPTAFIGALRPETERRIIPSTWREAGLGVHGSLGERVAYRAYVVSGLNATGFSADGLRGGRQGGDEAAATDVAVVGRLDYTPTPGIFVGGSVFGGGAGQGQVQLDGRDVGVQTTIFDLHGQAQIRGFDLRMLYARAHVGDAADLNLALGSTGADAVAETMEGGYVQIAYDVLSHTSRGDLSLSPFYRFEKVDTQASMPAGFARSPATDGTFHTLGLQLKPIPGVVVTADYQIVSNGAGTGRNQFDIKLGYAF